MTYWKILLIVVCGAAVFWIGAGVVSYLLGTIIKPENVILTFIGIIATFVVISNYAQVKELENRFTEKETYINSKIDKLNTEFYRQSILNNFDLGLFNVSIIYFICFLKNEKNINNKESIYQTVLFIFNDTMRLMTESDKKICLNILNSKISENELKNRELKMILELKKKNESLKIQ